MIRFAFLLAILIISSIFLIYKAYKRDQDKILALKKSLLLAILVAATIFSKELLIYLPLFIFHLAALLVGWGVYFAYLLNRVKIIWPIFLPVVTIFLFFLSAIFFSKD